MSRVPEEKEIFATQGFGRRLEPGRRSALIIVDFVNGFADPNHFGGGNINSAIDKTRILLNEARNRNLPICFTRIIYPQDAKRPTVFQRKVPTLAVLTQDNFLSAIVPSLRPAPGELVIDKQNPSAFFGTNLAQWLVGSGVDNLIIAGCTTSGCVRATVVDGMSYDYRCYIVQECVGDRAIESHEVSLFEMNQKYGDVCSLDQAVKIIDLSQDGREEPKPPKSSTRRGRIAAIGRERLRRRI